MTDKGPSHTFEDTRIRKDQPEDLIRQDYGVREADGQKYVILNAVLGLDLSLATMEKPNFEKARKMPVGV